MKLAEHDDLITFFPIEREPEPRPAPPPPAKPPVRLKALQAVLLSILVFGGALTVGTLLATERRSEESLAKAVSDFTWLVLVRGAQLQVDEVGRFLNQLDGVTRVSYVSPEQSLQRLSQDETLQKELSLLKSNPLPPIWEIAWTSDFLPVSRFEDAYQDIHSFPAVVDVAFDRKALELIHERRQRALEIKSVLSTLGVSASFLAVLLLGRFLFFVRGGRWQGRDFAFCLAVHGAAALAAFVVVRAAEPGAPLFLAALGVASGSLHYLWRRSRLS